MYSPWLLWLLYIIIPSIPQWYPHHTQVCGSAWPARLGTFATVRMEKYGDLRCLNRDVVMSWCDLIDLLIKNGGVHQLPCAILLISPSPRCLYHQDIVCSSFPNHMGVCQNLLLSMWVGWTPIFQLFWCSPGLQGLDPKPYIFRTNEECGFHTSLWMNGHEWSGT